MVEILTQVKSLEERFRGALGKVSNDQDLLRLKSAYLGKEGHLALLLKEVGHLPLELRPLVGQEANSLKNRIEESCRELLRRFEEERKSKKIRSEKVDATLPGIAVSPGHPHPIRQVLDEIEDIFLQMGFSIFEGPEVEEDYYNFEALNIPANHPARDMQDTFYIGGNAAPSASGRCGPHPPKPLNSAQSKSDAELLLSGGNAAPSESLLLRTHTSPVQIHVMESHSPPIRMIAPGAVYRRDSDISHTPMFHQVEGLVVDEGIRFSDLKGTVTLFLERFFGRRPVRFRPSYFPFTEPSAEVDVGCVQCNGRDGTSNNRPSASLPANSQSSRTTTVRSGCSSAERLASEQFLEVPSKCRLCGGTGWLEVMGCGMVHPAVFRKVRYPLNILTGFAFGVGIERLAMLKLGIPDIRLFFENDLRFLSQF